MDLKEKLENYFTGRKSRLEYDLLREITEGLYDDKETKKRALTKLDLYENREVFFGKTLTNICTFGALLSGFLRNNLLTSGMAVVISESARNFFDYYFTKTRRQKLIYLSEKLNKKKELLQEQYFPEEEKKENKEEKKYKNEEDFRIDTSGYQGWLNPNEEDPK